MLANTHTQKHANTHACAQTHTHTHARKIKCTHTHVPEGTAAQTLWLVETVTLGWQGDPDC